MNGLLSNTDLSSVLKILWSQCQWVHGYHDTKPNLDEFVIFNGSNINVFFQGEEHDFFAFRALYKNMPTSVDFPSMKWTDWYHSENFIGIVQHDKNVDVYYAYTFKGTVKTYDILRQEKQNIEKYLERSGIKNTKNMHILNDIFRDPGPEDPRLIFKPPNVILQYNLKNMYTVDQNTGGCPTVFFENQNGTPHSVNLHNCVAIYETVLKSFSANTVSLIDDNLQEGSMVCPNVEIANTTIPKSLMGNGGIYPTSRIIKNWSSTNDGLYLDAYNHNRYLFRDIGNGLCKLEKYDYDRVSSPPSSPPPISVLQQNDPNLIDLKALFPANFTVALTTPTIKETSTSIDGYGVAHIRIGLRNLFNVYNNQTLLPSDNRSLFEVVRKNIEFNDNTTNDIYLMCVYKTLLIPSQEFTQQSRLFVTDPFLITGPLNDSDYSYIINFPCGIDFYNNKLRITYGVGDCLFYLTEFDPQNMLFYNTPRNYLDIKIIPTPNLMFSRQLVDTTVFSMVENIRTNFMRSFFMVLFDLGGSGLKIRYIDTRGNILYDGPIYITTNKDIINRLQINLTNLTMMIESSAVNLTKVVFGFSVASLDKLTQNHVALPGITKLRNLVGLPSDNPTDKIYINRKLCTEMSDIIAHFYSCCSVIAENTNFNYTGTILVIAVGSYVNIAMGNIAINGERSVIIPNIQDIKIVDNTVLTQQAGFSFTLGSVDKIMTKKIGDIDADNVKLETYIQAINNAILPQQKITDVFITGNRLSTITRQSSNPKIANGYSTTMRQINTRNTVKNDMVITRLNTRAFPVYSISCQDIPFTGLVFKLKHNIMTANHDGYDM